MPYEETNPRQRLFALCWRGPTTEGFENCLDEIKELIESKKVKVNDVDEINVTALRFAAQFGHVEIVKYLLSKGASTKIVAKDGRDALFSAVENYQLEVVKVLLEAGASTKVCIKEMGKKEKLTPLSVARSKGYIEMEELLVAHGAKDPKSWTCSLM